MEDPENGMSVVDISSNSNGQSSQTNLVENRARTKKSRPIRTDQAESSLSTQNVPREQVDTKSEELKYSAAHVIQIFVPVSLCMLVVIASMQTIGYFSRDDGVYLLYTPFTKQTDNPIELLGMSLGNAAVMLIVIMIMTVVLIALYKFRFYRVIHVWLIISSVMLLGFFSAAYLEELFKNYNFAVDIITFYFIVWNFAVLGIICVHWKGPHRLQQFYLVMMSALMALVFIKHLPEWSVWTVLAFLAIWDLVAVLCPNGPLRILVETAQERNEPIFPALIYSSAVLYPYVLAVDSNESDDKQQLTTPDTEQASSSQPTQIQHLTTQGQRIAPLRGRNQANNSAILAETNNQVEPQHEIEERGIKLGLGDFIFYSVLVGKASSYGDWNTTIACYVAILLGLSFTLMLLALLRKALPALPISIFIGIVFYFATRLVTPFVTEVSINQYLL